MTDSNNERLAEHLRAVIMNPLRAPEAADARKLARSMAWGEGKDVMEDVGLALDQLDACRGHNQMPTSMVDRLNIVRNRVIALDHPARFLSNEEDAKIHVHIDYLRRTATEKDGILSIGLSWAADMLDRVRERDLKEKTSL